MTPDGRPLLRGVFEPTVPAGRRAFQGTRRGRRSPAPPWSGTRGAEGDVSDLILPSFSRSAFALVSVCYDRFLSRGGEAAPEPPASRLPCLRESLSPLPGQP